MNEIYGWELTSISLVNCGDESGVLARKIALLFLGLNEILGGSKETEGTINLHTVMTTTKEHDERMAKMTFSSVYPHYVTKVERKNRSVNELHQVIEWLTGYDENKLKKLINEKVTFEKFFKEAKLHPNAGLITGVICGYRIENIENPLTQQVRYLDKLVDELANGRKMEKILRGNKLQ